MNKTTLRRTGGIAVSAAILCVGSAMMASTIVANPGSAAQTLQVPQTAVPAGEYVGVCPDPAHLPKGAVAAGTDPQFSPESETAASEVTALVLNASSGNIPASTLSRLGSTDPLRTLAGGEGNSTGPENSGKSDPAAGTDTAAGAKLSAATVPSEEVKAPAVLRAQPHGQQEAAAGAVMTYSAADGDLRGLAAANCQRPSNDLWILGANTTLGQTALLNLHNPSSTPATVDLALFGAEGPIDAPGGRGILVPPGQTESIVLGGLAPDQNQLAVRVHSSGGSVTANIQQSVLRDLTPGGVEYLSPSAGPSTRQVVTGVRIQDDASAAAISSQDGYGSASPVLQIAVPGSSEAVLEVRAFGPNGQEPLAEGGVLTVPGETVQEVPLDGLPEGTYTLSITSDVSVTATARVSKGTEPGEPVDMGFIGSVDRMGARHVIPVPGGVDSKLVFGAPFGDAEVDLTAIGANGEPAGEQTLRIAGGTTEQVETDDGGGSGVVGYVASVSGQAVYGSQLLTDGGANISVVQVPAAVNGEQELPVKLGY